MFNKIFLAVFVVAVLMMGGLAFLCYLQLQSIGFPPLQIAENFVYFDGIYKTALWISSLVLLIFANVALWTYRKGWALWLTFAYFGIFLMLNLWWLGDSLISFKKQNGLWEGGFTVGGLVGAIFVVVTGIGLFFNQFLVFRMRDKMFDKPQEQVDSVTEKDAEITEVEETEKSDSVTKTGEKTPE